MSVEEVIGGVREIMTVRRVFGEPYEKEGVTVIPAARVRGAPVGAEARGPPSRAKEEVLEAAMQSTLRRLACT